MMMAAWMLLGGGARGAITSLDDIHFWVGSGANRAGFAVDWNGDSASDSSLVWGFRWNGTAKGADMLRAVIAADPRLFAKLGNNGPPGVAVRGIGYDLNDDNQFALDDETQFDGDGVAASGPTDGAAAVDSADLYHEGWFLGAWTYATADANPWTDGAWAYSGAGPSSRPLMDGSWDSWAFTPTFKQNAFAANAAPAVQAADFDSNGAADGVDFLTWQRSAALAAGVSRALGDASGDGVVNAADLAAWQSQFGGAGAFAVASAVPEPQSLTTCASAMFVLFFQIVRQRRRSAS